MGCNCKQQPKSPITPKVIQVNNAEVELMTKPTYTEEELTRLENWIISVDKSKEDNEFVKQFNLQHFGENIIGYCDIACQHRIRRRVEHMKEKLNKWKKDQ